LKPSPLFQLWIAVNPANTHLTPGGASAVDRAAAAHVLALRIDPLRDGEIGSGSAVIVGVEGDLLVARAACKRPIEDFLGVRESCPR
jgi:hypothetical protein